MRPLHFHNDKPVGLVKIQKGVPVLSQNGPKTDITPTHHLTASTCYIHIACSFRQEYWFMHAYWYSRILDNIDYMIICVYELYNYINIISWFTANRKLWGAIDTYWVQAPQELLKRPWRLKKHISSFALYQNSLGDQAPFQQKKRHKIFFQTNHLKKSQVHHSQVPYGIPRVFGKMLRVLNPSR